MELGGTRGYKQQLTLEHGGEAEGAVGSSGLNPYTRGVCVCLTAERGRVTLVLFCRFPRRID